VHAAYCQQLDWRLVLLIIFSIQDYIHTAGNQLSNAPFISHMNYSYYKRKYLAKLLVRIV